MTIKALFEQGVTESNSQFVKLAGLMKHVPASSAAEHVR